MEGEKFLKMENKININGIEYIRVDSIKKEDFKIGDLINYNGYEWYIIKLEKNYSTLMMKDCLSEDKIKELFDDKYLDDEYDVKFNLDVSNNDWQDSIIKKVLNYKFFDEFNIDELSLMNTNYDENKYSTDLIRIPTIREIERLSDNIKFSNKNYWTMSPSYFYSSLAGAIVWRVYSSGRFGAYWTSYGCGVRPVIKVKNKFLEKGDNNE